MASTHSARGEVETRSVGTGPDDRPGDREAQAATRSWEG